MDKILVDQEGYLQFWHELDKIKEEYTDNANTGGEAYKDAVGDGWHDNFAYESAMAEERKINAKLKKIQDDQSKLEVISSVPYDENKINIGDIIKVKIIYADDDIEEETIKLTGKYIPDTTGKIMEVTLNSPLGKALYMQNINDNIFYTVGDKRIRVIVLERSM